MKPDLKMALERHQRAHATERLCQELAAGVRSMAPTYSHGERFKTVEEAADAILERLTALAKALPSGAQAMDPTANIDAHTTDHLAEVRDLIQRLGHIVGWLPGRSGNRGITADLLTVLDIPAVGHSVITRHDGAEQTPDPHREFLRALAKGAAADADVALIDVIRGDYPGVTVRLARSRAEQEERDQRVHEALQTQWVDR